MENKMQTSSLDGGTFEKWTGIPWTAGLSYRDRNVKNLTCKKVDSISSRWFFEINGVQYSAKSISPRIKDIQMHVETPSEQWVPGCH